MLTTVEVLSNDLKVLTSEIKGYEVYERMGAFEIGKRLSHAKKQIKPGAFRKWIEELGYSKRNAEKYMQVQREYGFLGEKCGFSFTVLCELLSLPKEVNKAEFLSNKHNGKKVNEMTKSEVRDLIKSLKQQKTPLVDQTDLGHNHTDQTELGHNNTILEKIIFIVEDDFKWKIELVKELTSQQHEELLSCCLDNSYNVEPLLLINLVKKGYSHVEIREQLKGLGES